MTDPVAHDLREFLEALANVSREFLASLDLQPVMGAARTFARSRLATQILLALVHSTPSVVHAPVTAARQAAELADAFLELLDHETSEETEG